MPAGLPPMIGQQLGHYRVVDRIGAGGMGEVYRARDERLDRDVAIKVLNEGIFQDAQARKRFRQEALALSRSRHPGIATIHDFDTQNGVDFLVMEYIPGQSLAEMLQDGALPAAKVADLGAQLAEALDHAHSAGIVHRDLKPGNLRITPEGRLKILDFGVARLLAASDDTTRTDPTVPGIAGTLAYMAPEQLCGAPVDARTDIYSAGAVLYEMLTGSRPFPDRQEGRLVDAILHATPVPPRALVPGITESLQAVVLKALARLPADRHQSASELRGDLLQAAQTVPSGPPPPIVHPHRRSGPAIRWVAAIAIVLSLLATGLRVLRPKPSAPAEPAAVAAPLKLAILPVRGPADSKDTAGWPAIVETLFASELTGLDRVGVMDPLSLQSRVRQALGAGASGPPLLQLLRTDGVSLALDTYFVREANAYELRVNVIDPAAEQVRFSPKAPVADEGALPSAVARLADEIVSYLQVQSTPLAAENVRPWVSLRTHNVDAVREFAQANEYIASYQPEEARRHLRRAIELDPELIGARVWLIPGLLNSGQRAAAESAYRDLLRLEPKASPFEGAMIGYVGAILKNDVTSEIRYLNLGLRYSPGNNVLMMNLGGLQTNTGDYARALDTFRPLVRARWPFPPLYPYFGLCAIMTGQLDEAQDALEASLRLPGVDPNVYGLLELLAAARGNRSAADDYAARGKAAGLKYSPPLPQAFDLLATRAYDQRAFDRAEDLYRRMSSRNPADPRAHLMLGRIAETRGDVPAAVREFEEYLRLGPEGGKREAVRARVAELKRRLPHAAR